MKLHSTLVAIVAIALSSCTAILTETTGDQGIRENPAERTTGAMIEDEVIETKIAVNMRSQEPLLNVEFQSRKPQQRCTFVRAG